MIRTVGAVSVLCPFFIPAVAGRWEWDGWVWLGRDGSGGTGYLLRPLLSFLCSELVYIGVAKEGQRRTLRSSRDTPYPPRPAPNHASSLHPPLRGNVKKDSEALKSAFTVLPLRGRKRRKDKKSKTRLLAQLSNPPADSRMEI